MKKLTVLVAILLCLAMSYAQETPAATITDDDGTVYYYICSEKKADGSYKHKYAVATEMEKNVAVEKTSTSTAQASSATATTGYSIDDLVKLMAIAKGMNGGSGADPKLALLEQQIELLKQQNAALMAQLTEGNTSGKRNKGDNTNKIVKADLAFDVIDTGLDAVSLGFQLSDWIKNRGGNNSRGSTNWNQGSTRTRTTDWGYGDVVRTGTGQGRTSWNNGR